MALTSLANKRAKLYTQIFTYKQRREAFRIKYNVSKSFPFRGTPEYHKAVKKINWKIKLWGRQMKNIDKTANRIIALGNIVATFTGCNVKDSGRNSFNSEKYERMKLARSLFYKFGLENKMQAKLLREYVGANRVNQPAEYRLQFNRSFVTNPSNKEKWETFKKYYNETPITTSDFIDVRATPGV